VRAILAISTIAAMLWSTQGRAAQSVADFYKRTTLMMQVGSGPAGGYDVVARLAARYMSQYIPGHPTIVVQNVPGGGSLVLANQFANTTKNDGSYIGVMNSGMATTPLLDPTAVHFDPRKFGFLGSPAQEVELLVVWNTAPVRNAQDLFTKKLIVGASSPGSATYDVPYLTNALLGTKFDIIPGYPDSNDVKLALERGEVQGDAALGLSSLRTQFADVLASHKLLVVAQYGSQKAAALPNVPLFPLGKTAADRQMLAIAYARSYYGQPFVTPPGVPADRFAALKKAFEATMANPGFLADAKRANLAIDPIPGQDLQALTERLFATSPAVLKRLQDLIAEEGKGG
jgi:tripartite-type tricarboxylate transporter receptor subunit TctC